MIFNSLKFKITEPAINSRAIKILLILLRVAFIQALVLIFNSSKLKCTRNETSKTSGGFNENEHLLGGGWGCRDVSAWGKP